MGKMLFKARLRRIFLILLLTVVIAGQAGRASAGDNVWTRINSPECGAMTVVAVSPLTPHSVYVGREHWAYP